MLVSKVPVSAGIELVLHLQTPVSNRPEFHCEAEEWEHGVDFDTRKRTIAAFDRTGGKLAVGALKRCHLANLEIHAASGHQRAHFVDAVRCAAKFIAAMHQRQTLRSRL